MNVNGGGQECPSHTNFAETSLAVPFHEAV